MIIKCNLKNHYFRYFNEARGVALRRNKLLKNNKTLVLKYSDYILIIDLVLIILIGISCYIESIEAFIFGMMLLVLTIVFNVYVFINTLAIVRFRKKNNYDGEIVLSKEGLSNSSFYGIKLTFEWKKIKAIVVMKKTVIILTDTPIYFYQSLENKDVIIEGIRKFKKDILIVNK